MSRCTCGNVYDSVECQTLHATMNLNFAAGRARAEEIGPAPSYDDTATSVGCGPRTEGRRGDWMATFTGRRFWPLDPRPGDFDIRDIAHALCKPRFGGHARWLPMGREGVFVPYTIAQHSLNVLAVVRRWIGDGTAQTVDSRRALLRWALLHDASEAYCEDIVRPLKRSTSMDGYRIVEGCISDALCEQFGIVLTDEVISVVKQADNVVLRVEAETLMQGASEWNWQGVEVPPWIGDVVSLRATSMDELSEEYELAAWRLLGIGGVGLYGNAQEQDGR